MIKGLFRLSHRNPVETAVKYISVVKNRELESINRRSCIQVVCGHGEPENYNDFKTYLSTSFLHPISYNISGSLYLDDWYDDEKIHRMIRSRMPFYDPDHLYLYDGYMRNHTGFINTLKNKHINIDQDTVDRYIQFMYLAKKYDGQNLKFVPPFDVDIMWHSHMLDHRSYVKDTKEYFGRILNHSDSVAKEKLEVLSETTATLWKKEFGVPFL